MGGESREWLRSESVMDEDMVDTSERGTFVSELVVYSIWLVISLRPGMAMGALDMGGGEVETTLMAPRGISISGGWLLK